MKLVERTSESGWRVIHDHQCLTFPNMHAALAYAKGYARHVDLVEMIDSQEHEVILIEDTVQSATALGCAA